MQLKYSFDIMLKVTLVIVMLQSTVLASVGNDDRTLHDAMAAMSDAKDECYKGEQARGSSFTFGQSGKTAGEGTARGCYWSL